MSSGNAGDRQEQDEAELIRKVERGRLRALVAANVEVAEPLHAEDFQLITPSGRKVSKAEYMGDIASGVINYLSWEPGAIEVQVYGEVAIIRYRAEIEIVVRGERSHFRSWHTDSYRKSVDGQWEVVWSQATEIS
nr:Unknown Function [uncultured bacterium]